MTKLSTAAGKKGKWLVITLLNQYARHTCMSIMLSNELRR